MNIAGCFRHTSMRMRGKLFLIALFFVGLLHAPSVAAQTFPSVPSIAPAATVTAPVSSVPVDQQPLSIRQPVPPNIMLMLDDSGSMAYDYMPDWQYIGHCNGYWNCDPTIDELRDSSINGTYYNPDVIYSPPPTATGGDFGDSPGLGDAYKNGFTDRDNDDEVDITKCGSSYSDPCDNYNYYEKYTGNILDPYDPSPGCAGNDDLMTHGDYDGECRHIDGESYSWYEMHYSWYWGYYCDRGDKKDKHKGHWMCRTETNTYSYYKPTLDNPSCPNGGDYDETTNQCLRAKEYTAYLFVYETHDSSGNAMYHFVGKDRDDCAIALSQGPAGSDCDYSNDTQQNVANWFSYYRTRMLMAKSGLMTAFSGMSSTYRFGFGSLHNNGGFASDVDLWCDSKDSCSHSDSSRGYEKVLAILKPFGDGSSTSQKGKFWHWIIDTKPNNGTPLRSALQAVGTYYGTKQPWESTDSSGNTQMLACRQSYTIMTTDGFWNSGSTNVGNADGDSDGGPTIKNTNGGSFQYLPKDPYKDDNSNTLADVAMYYWDHDLRSDINNEVPTNDADPAFWQHMVTFTIGMGFLPEYKVKNSDNASMTSDIVDALFNWAKSGVQPSSLGSWDGWLKPDGDGNGTLNNINDLVHAALNGHGGFYSATDPLSFATGLKSALDRATARTGSGASLAANSTQLKTGTMAYQAIYHTKLWTGELKAYEVDPVTGKLATDVTWNAADVMPSAANRNIYTYNPVSKAYLAFKDDGTTSPPALSSDQLAALGSDVATRTAMVDYLRGDDSANNSSWRQRDGILGDIVDSQPVYVGEVNANQFSGRTFKGSDKFAQYASDQQTRDGLIYVAANDGMLHAFDAETGVETYAYLPAAVITHGSSTGGISQFADPNYGDTDTPHQYFNDGQLTVADAYFDNTWHTVLVGTTGRGFAKAVYALDVTDPDNIKFMWERSAYTDATTCPNCSYIGQMNGKPIIAQVGDGKWAVLMGNGYNSAKDQAALLQFALKDGALTVHTAGTDTANGLAAPAIWLGDAADNISTVAYAGDLKGHVWSFQLSSLTKQDDGSYTATSTPSSVGTLLFTAKDSDDNVQPITAGMLIGRNPDTGDLWAFFGTGRYLASDDIKDTSVQSWYGLIVHVNGTDQGLVDNLTKDGRTALAQRSIIAQFPGSSTKNDDGTTTVILPTRVMTPADDATSMSGKSGWYIDLKTPAMKDDGTVSSYSAEGERMVSPNQFQGSRLIATSIVPKSTDLCNPSGTGWIMALEPFTGTNPEPQFYDVNGDGKINSEDMVKVGDKTYAAGGVGFNSLPNAPIFVGGAMLTSFDNGTTSSVMTSGAGGSIQRVSWRELVNP